MNDSALLVEASKWYELLKAMVEMNDFGLWAQGYRYY